MLQSDYELRQLTIIDLLSKFFESNNNRNEKGAKRLLTTISANKGTVTNS